MSWWHVRDLSRLVVGLFLPSTPPLRHVWVRRATSFPPFLEARGETSGLQDCLPQARSLFPPAGRDWPGGLEKLHICDKPAKLLEPSDMGGVLPMELWLDVTGA